MSRSLAFGLASLIGLGFAPGLALTGCLGRVAESTTSQEIVAVPASAVLGPIGYGQTQSASYSNPPHYRAYQFNGAAGDAVDIWVRSPDGDATAWLLNASNQTVAFNDDADSTTSDSRIATTLPTAGSYLIAFREQLLNDAHFTVTLGGTPSGCAIGGAAFANGTTNPSNACQVCDVSQSSSAWSSASDGGSCGGVGDVCQSGQCVYGCIIPGFGNLNAFTYNLGDQCQSCNPAVSTTAWTTVACNNTYNPVSCWHGLCCESGAPYTCASWGRSASPRYNGQSSVAEADGCGGNLNCY